MARPGSEAKPCLAVSDVPESSRVLPGAFFPGGGGDGIAGLALDTREKRRSWGVVTQVNRMSLAEIQERLSYLGFTDQDAELLPHANTVPSGSSVAEWRARREPIAPVEDQDAVLGS